MLVQPHLDRPESEAAPAPVGLQPPEKGETAVSPLSAPPKGRGSWPYHDLFERPMPQHAGLSGSFDSHSRLHRIGYEADLVSLVVQALELLLARSSARPGDSRMERDLGHRMPSGRLLLQDAFRMIVVGRDGKSGQPRYMQEREHVAAREGRDQHFFRI